MVSTEGSQDGKFFNFEIVEALGTIALGTQSLSINFDDVFPADEKVNAHGD